MIAPVRTCMLLTVVFAVFTMGNSQPVTGVWRGRVIKGSGLLKQTYKLEVKLVKNGDSITGTSYYYASPNHYFRYSVKGYFGTQDNSINWWDDQLLESRAPNVKLGSANSQPLLSVADYNCPGSGVMLLDGRTQPIGGDDQYGLHLQKMEHPDFRDEWDPIIETYSDGGADPYLIDSVSQIAFLKPVVPVPPPVAIVPGKESTDGSPASKDSGGANPAKEIIKGPELMQNPWKSEPDKKPDPAVSQPDHPEKPAAREEKQTQPITSTKPEITGTPEAKPVIQSVPSIPAIEDKFTRRKTVLHTTIPVAGDTMEFKFYDNAEVDGDSISIFLNGKLLYTHIRLTDRGYSIKVPVTSLQSGDNELVMVAENLGSIPPNTAYMEAWSGGRRYTARMESTEKSSALIKLKKE